MVELYSPEATVVGHTVMHLPSKTLLGLVPGDIAVRHGRMYLVLAVPKVLKLLEYEEKECLLTCFDFKNQEIVKQIFSSRQLFRFISCSENGI